NIMVQERPGTVRPGQNLNLLCKVTGASITSNSYAWQWVRQPPGKGLEWIASIYPYDGRKWFSSSLQSRTIIASDNSKNEYSLHLNSMSVSDTAVYYCARDAH
uniref:Ig-like domain-containing protein n=1 Tax=Naja naja TaxID=35670 RepID=A0A8C6X7I4_NAJNA